MIGDVIIYKQQWNCLRNQVQKNIVNYFPKENFRLFEKLPPTINARINFLFFSDCETYPLSFLHFLAIQIPCINILYCNLKKKKKNSQILMLNCSFRTWKFDRFLWKYVNYMDQLFIVFIVYLLLEIIGLLLQEI